MSLGKGEIQSVSCKQKINTCSSTEEELVSCHLMIFWPNDVDQTIPGGYEVMGNVVFRDNENSMKL